MSQGTPPWRDGEPPTPCPKGCGHQVHWNPCETAETPLMPAPPASTPPPPQPQGACVQVEGEGRDLSQEHAPTTSAAQLDRAALIDPALQPPPAEFDEGYPTEEWIAALEAHVFNPFSAARWLVTGFPHAVSGISCCNLQIEPGDYHGDPARRLTFVTGGWSGAEDLISAALSHFWVNRFHSMWKRGGLFEFIIPEKMLAAPDDGGTTQPSTTGEGDKSRDESDV